MTARVGRGEYCGDGSGDENGLFSSEFANLGEKVSCQTLNIYLKISDVLLTIDILIRNF